MVPALNSISITDFRSIRGTVTVPLGSPVVLIHGPNGSGKTSVLSALELALTGDILAMRRTEPAYATHLVHHGRDSSRIEVRTADGDAKSPPPHQTLIKGGVIEGALSFGATPPASSPSGPIWRKLLLGACWRSIRMRVYTRIRPLLGSLRTCSDLMCSMP